ncbi:replication-relaxation family protein [Micromonospora sp. CPCC 205371]|nr:replication-relaxation family protein [Micromonospora sp. CPCC 205371]
MTDHVLRIQSALTDRDHVLLGWLADHGVLTTAQIAHALFPSVDFAQERLRKLAALGVLARFRPQRPDGGSHPYHYVLDQLGVDVVSAQRGDELPRRDAARKRRWHLTNRANLPHLLGVNQFFIELAGYARTHPEARLERWWPASRMQGRGAFAEPGDDVQILVYKPRIRPDGHGIWVEHEARVPFFVEYDTGTEPLGVLVDKLFDYAALAKVTGRVWPVLFWLHAAARERHLHQHLDQEGIALPVATTARDDAVRTGASPPEAVWWLHRHPGGLLRLADLAATVFTRKEAAA